MKKFDFAQLGAATEAYWPVTVNVPQDGGKTLKQEMTVRFRLPSDEALIATRDAAEPQKALLRLAVVGLGPDEGVEFTPEVLELLVAKAYVRTALETAFLKFASGVAEKN